MPIIVRPSFVAAFLLPTFFVAHACGAEAGKSGKKPDVEAATRLQVFLDRAEFAPGKIDGRHGGFTLKALALYRQAQGGNAGPAENETKGGKAGAPDVSDLDMDKIDPVFVDYTVTEADMKTVGELADTVPAQAKQKSLPYKNAAESIAEKFHMDRDFLSELNPGKTESIKAGDSLRVPNVEPFDPSAAKRLEPGSEMGAKGANDIDDESDGKPAEGKKSAGEKHSNTGGTSVKVDVKTNMLSVFENDKLIAAYPVTVGSAQTQSPVGDWTVRGVAMMPDFRYDEAMLEKGERSENFYLLPPGPNNLVGVAWIALNKKGIGLHGTSEPDTIGRSASHGCVRLANWDIVRVAAKVKAGVAVSIH